MRRCLSSPARAGLAALATLVAAAAGLCPGAGPARADTPRLDPDHPVQCFTDPKGVPWRVQCNDLASGGPGTCVMAIDGEVDSSGTLARPLDRARPCSSHDFDLAAARAKGYTVVRGTADAPRGWMRDDRGRVFQVTFDLHKRMYGGVSWRPTLEQPGGDQTLGRAAFDVELLELELTTGDARTGYRHRLRVGQGEIDLAPFGADATLLRYDFSRKRADPLFRITTFFGTPRRFDIDAHLGGWFEVAHLETAEVAPGQRNMLMREFAAQLTWDLWRSPDMESFIRLRSGLGAERSTEDGQPDRNAVAWAGAAEGDLTLGQAGYNHLTFLGQLERPMYFNRDAGVPSSARRALVRLGFERILIAVNDQPVTLHVGGEAEYRDDLPSVAPGWDLRAVAGLRLNLWAPPR